MIKKIISFCLIFCAVGCLFSCTRNQQSTDFSNQPLVSKKEIMDCYSKACEICNGMEFKGLEVFNGKPIFEDYKVMKNKFVIKYLNNEDITIEKEMLNELVNKINDATQMSSGIDNYYIFSYNSRILEEVVKALPSGRCLSADVLKILICY